MFTRPRSLLVCLWLALLATLGLVSCAVPLGPGYTTEKQSVEVHFAAASGPQIEVQGLYELKNTGNQPLAALEILLPDQTLYNTSEARIEWDGAPLIPEIRSEPIGRIARLTFASPWAIRSRHSLRIAYSISPPAPGAKQLDFASDAFFLSAEGWNPALRPSPGVLGTGGGTPERWQVAVRVPQNFLVRSSGRPEKTNGQGAEKLVKFLERRGDVYPFVLAGRYTPATLNVGRHTFFFWTRNPRDPALLRSAAASIGRVIDSYDAAFGPRSKDARSVGIVECPARSLCEESSAHKDALLPALKRGRIAADLAFLDAAVLDSSSSAHSVALAAAPLLAASWLGYGRNPDFWKQELPMSELPSYAVGVARESLLGPSARAETIRRALAAIPRGASAEARGSEPLTREKSLLFFFALEDQFGRDRVHAALRHMVQARLGLGYDLNILIAALEQETRQKVAEFVRHWLKHPGVSEEFRARYAAPATPANPAPKENPQ